MSWGPRREAHLKFCSLCPVRWLSVGLYQLDGGRNLSCFRSQIASVGLESPPPSRCVSVFNLLVPPKVLFRGFQFELLCLALVPWRDLQEVAYPLFLPDLILGGFWKQDPLSHLEMQARRFTWLWVSRSPLLRITLSVFEPELDPELATFTSCGGEPSGPA